MQSIEKLEEDNVGAPLPEPMNIYLKAKEETYIKGRVKRPSKAPHSLCSQRILEKAENLSEGGFHPNPGMKIDLHSTLIHGLIRSMNRLNNST